MPALAQGNCTEERPDVDAPACLITVDGPLFHIAAPGAAVLLENLAIRVSAAAGADTATPPAPLLRAPPGPLRGAAGRWQQVSPARRLLDTGGGAQDAAAGVITVAAPGGRVWLQRVALASTPTGTARMPALVVRDSAARVGIRGAHFPPPSLKPAALTCAHGRARRQNA